MTTEDMQKKVNEAKRTEFWTRFWHLVGRASIFVAICGVVVGTFAAAQGKVLANCTNKQLASRSTFATQQTDAEIAKADAEANALQQLLDAKSGGEAQAAVTAFKGAADVYVAALNSLKKQRDANPLGTC